jgi:3-hydroxyacyl-[acyl-carrier-protein] dehydratase
MDGPQHLTSTCFAEPEEAAMPPEIHYDPAQLDLNRVVADRDQIRRVNPQRFEMEQLTAIVLMDRERLLVAGYKDVTADEFWVKGHMPGYPIYPGVLMCEAAAQLCAYYTFTQGLCEGDFIGFAGLENVRFRSPVHPGDRLVLIGKGVRLHRRQTIFNVQGFVGPTMVFHADILGVPMKRQGEE